MIVHSELTCEILKCCFDVMNTLGIGLLENVYQNALKISLEEAGLKYTSEQGFKVMYKDHLVGYFRPDLLIEDSVIVELKCCQSLLSEHHAQLINYLTITGIKVGLLVNFGKRKLEYKRLYHPSYPVQF